MKICACLLSLFVLAPVAHAESTAPAVYLPSVYASLDGDGLHTKKYRTGFYPSYTDADNGYGVEYTRSDFRLADWHMTGDQVAVFAKRFDPQTSQGHSYKLGYNTLHGQSLVTVDASYNARLDATTTGEVTYSRDRVEVQPSLRMGVYASFVSASVEKNITPPVKLMLTLGETYYSDTNHRALVKLRAHYDVLPEQGLAFQLRYRTFQDSNTQVQSGYFNPAKFVEHMAAVDIRKVLAGWTLQANLGLGFQAANQDAKTVAKAFEFSANTVVAHQVSVRAKMGYLRSLGINGPDFVYRYLGEDVVITF